MEDEVNIQVRFSRQTEDGVTFTDALYFTPADYEALTEGEIEALEDERFQRWQEVVSSPSPEPSAADQLADIEQQIAQLEELKAALAAEDN